MQKQRPKIVECPPLEELGKNITVPQLPKFYRSRLWKTIKVRVSFMLPEETQHFLNMMCLHFGLSRNEVVIHAVNLLWQEVLNSLDADQVKLYEDKLEAVRLYRLRQSEEEADAYSKANEEAIQEYVKSTGDARETRSPQGTVWTYRQHYPSGDALEHARSDEENE